MEFFIFDSVPVLNLKLRRFLLLYLLKLAFNKILIWDVYRHKLNYIMLDDLV